MQRYFIFSSSITGNKILKRKGGLGERKTSGRFWMACVPEPATTALLMANVYLLFFFF